MLDRHIDRHGYTEVYLPYMVREQTIFGAGQLPKFRDNLYHDAEEDYWMVPTAEVPITGLYSGEILPPGALPLKHVAYTACFRREKMSAGKDIRGLKRGHQFDKVEMYQIVEPEDSTAALQDLVAHAQDIAAALGLPHRLLQLCAGDLGFAAAESYDIEVWAAGCQEWLEVSSCSNCADFQARRANIRYRTEQNARPAFPHTLNGSGPGPAAHHDRHPGEQPAGRRLGAWCRRRCTRIRGSSGSRRVRGGLPISAGRRGQCTLPTGVGDSQP